jgi:hypothetical protein
MLCLDRTLTRGQFFSSAMAGFCILSVTLGNGSRLDMQLESCEAYPVVSLTKLVVTSWVRRGTALPLSKVTLSGYFMNRPCYYS